MRATLFSVIAFTLIFSSATLPADEIKDEIKFDQNRIITVDIETKHQANETYSYPNYGYMGLGVAALYAFASLKIGAVQALNWTILGFLRYRLFRS